MSVQKHYHYFFNIFQTLSHHFMKNKFYASLFIGIGLTVGAVPSFAKAAQPTVKKQVSSSAKSAKANAHNSVSKKNPLSNTTAKQKPSPSKHQSLADAKDTKHGKTKAQQLADAKDTKHGKTKAQQLADAKDTKHGKTKAQQLADAKDTKHGKTKAQQLADAKDTKHGKTKAQQLADAKDTKHGKTKAQQLADAKDSKHHKTKSHRATRERYEEENEEDASTAIETDEQVQAADDSGNADSSVIDQINPNYAPSHQAIDTRYSEDNSQASTFIATPTKSNLFFQPIQPPVATNTQPSDIPLHQTVDSQYNGSNEEQKSNPIIAAPTKLDNQTVDNTRMHSLITSGTKPYQSIDNSDEEESSSESSENNNLLIQPINNNKRVHSSIAHNTNNFIDNAANHETTQHVASTHGIIDSSLTSAGEKAGLSNEMVIQLTDIFAWDIDFANNLQEGDQFTVVYEEAVVGSKVNSNQIIAAQFINRGKTYTAIRYKDKEGMIGYYTPDGRSLRKAFLSTPIDFARVSSPFDPHRKHPILNRIRAHKGVDYAARTGTPVKAAGDGVITFHGNKGAYGRMIVLSHGEHYETAYAHLSNFRKDLQDGEPVKQGEVIGYVGQSGLATGPHLHYEFRVDGEHRDPEKLDSKQAMRLPNEVWEDFHAQTIPVLTQLNQAKANTLFAKNP